jgi:NMD protein affecting ribosome stability and mRNA decay
MGKSIRQNPMATNPVASPEIRNPDTVWPRDDIQQFRDPYRPDEHGAAGTVCSRCGAIYLHQHWSFDEAKRAQLEQSTAVHEVICPGCKKIADGYPEGIVTLRGDYWPQHEDEIMNLIRNEEQRAMGVNPLERIIDIRREGEELVVETTNEKLAQRIGHRIDKAHNGHVEYKWSGNNHLLRVYWQRTLASKS